MPIQSNLVAKTGVAANLAATATVYTTVQDLGANYGAGVAWVSKRGTASAGEVLSLEYSTDNVNWYPMVNYSLTGPSINAVSNANMDAGGRIQGRYLRGKFVNGSTIQASNAILSLYVQKDSV